MGENPAWKGNCGFCFIATGPGISERKSWSKLFIESIQIISKWQVKKNLSMSLVNPNYLPIFCSGTAKGLNFQFVFLILSLPQ